MESETERPNVYCLMYADLFIPCGKSSTGLGYVRTCKYASCRFVTWGLLHTNFIMNEVVGEFIVDAHEKEDGFSIHFEVLII